jgi:hypothetical protein
MAKLVKWGVSGSEVDELEVEDREDFEPYDGPMPPKNKILRVKAVKITAVKFSTGSRGVKLFMVVDDPANERYNGLPYWENVQDMASTNWKIRQFMDSIGTRPTSKRWRTATRSSPSSARSRLTACSSGSSTRPERTRTATPARKWRGS